MCTSQTPQGLQEKMVWLDWVLWAWLIDDISTLTSKGFDSPAQERLQ